MISREHSMSKTEFMLKIAISLMAAELLILKTFHHSKEPKHSKFFREIGWVDELGSEVVNIYK